jgi:hypothetical protein
VEAHPSMSRQKKLRTEAIEGRGSQRTEIDRSNDRLLQREFGGDD